ncbi:MAG: multicopper oxidase family protein [Inquilinus sp.]|nr:multicopper oxidase family protein [Inquilinus sp.]
MRQVRGFAHGPTLNRRRLLAAGGAATGLMVLPGPVSAAPMERRLRAAPGRAALVGAGYPDTEVWTYEGGVPGPLLRVPQGGRLRVAVENDLPQETTVHWHGLRIPLAMDGVPILSQPPIASGETFVYDFVAKDAGTFWYHPHVRGFEQVERGLSGVLIVDEPEPLAVDRDEVWVLDDWRLDQLAQVTEDFGHPMDLSHAGRLGNTVTVNGRIVEQVPVRAGERLRLRLVNVANARHFALSFEGHRPLVVAYDGQPVAPHEPEGGLIVLGPAMRADIVLDCEGRPGDRVSIVDRFYQGREYRLLDLAYDREAPLREDPLDAPRVLASNPVPEPDLRDALTAEIVFEGGMMGGMSAGMMNGHRTDMRSLMRAGKMWAVNGIVAVGEAMEPTVTVPEGRTAHFTLVNRTAWPHPIHLHGHHFRVLTRNGAPPPHREWRDTVLLLPEDRVEVAFVAGIVGDWLLHCHVLEHMAGGMLAVVRVA